MKKILLLAVFLVMISSYVYAGSFLFKAPNDKLEIHELMGDSLTTVTKSELADLEDGEVSTGKGNSKFHQYVRFKDSVVAINPPNTTMKKNENDFVSDYLFIKSGVQATNAMFEYEIEFEEGFKSDVVEGVLEDTAKIKIFKRELTIIRTKVDTSAKSIELDLAGGAILDLVNEGSKKIFTVNGHDYEVEVVSVNSNDKSVQLKVNGNSLTTLKKGEKTFYENVLIGINKVIISTSGSPTIVKLFVGADVIELKDTDYTDANFVQEVSVNKQKLTNAFVRIIASFNDNVFKISNIKYRITTNKDIYIKPNEKLTQHIDPKYMLVPWDIRYEGLDVSSENNIVTQPSGSDDEYTLTFKNQDNQGYSVPFVSNKGGTFKLGDNDQDLIVVEGSSSTSFNVDKDDYFVLTSANNKAGKTYILKYNSIDTASQTVQFTDLGGSTKSMIYQNSTTAGVLGEGTLTVGSVNAKIFVNNGSNNSLAIDLNGDNAINSAAMDIVTKGGGIIDLGTTNAISSPYTLTLTTQSSQFEESSSDETVTFQIQTAASNKIGIASFSGVQLFESAGNHFLGLTRYGVKFDNLDIENEAELLTIKYPISQIFSKVYIETGEATLSSITSSQVQSTCSNGVQDGDETGTDCGGSCGACPTCNDNIQNQGEGGVDCGGPCQECTQAQPSPTFGGICQGCVYFEKGEEEKCVPVGEAVEDFYCSPEFELKTLKRNGEICSESYECKISICENGKCGKKITLTKILVNIAIVGLLGIIIYLVTTLFL